MKWILAVVDYWPVAERVLERARRIAEALGGQLFLFCPVASELEELNRYIGFDNFDALKAQLLAEHEARLAALPGAEGIERAVEWAPAPYRAVERRVRELGAVLVVMARSEHHALGDFLHRPDDWHLLRDAPCPILLLDRAARECRAVVAAVDALDEEHVALNGRILDEAQILAQTLSLPLRVVSVVPDPLFAIPGFRVLDGELVARFRQRSLEVARERQSRLLERLGVAPAAQAVVVGRVVEVLEQEAEAYGLLAIGTLARRGLSGLFVGNTAERLLGHVAGDLLVVN